MKILALQKRAVLAGLFFYILSIFYAFIDPVDKYEQLNKLIESLAAPQFGEFNSLIVIGAAALSLLLYLVFYFLAYRNSNKAIYIFVGATVCAFIVFIADLGPQLSSAVSEIISTLACTIDGVIVAFLLLAKDDDA